MMLKHHVLHIRTGPTAVIEEMQRALDDHYLSADACDDVYRAVARLGREPESKTKAVIVCLDGLAPIELEFIPLLRRLRPDIQLLVYSGNPQSTRKDTALDLGATGLATNAALQTLSMSIKQAPPNQTHPQPTATTPPDPTTKPVSGPTIRLTPPNDALDERSFKPHEVDENPLETAPTPPLHEEEMQQPVQFPWRYRAGAPKRVAPERTPPPQRPVNEGPRSFDPSQPLLTDEELRALMADDSVEGHGIGSERFDGESEAEDTS